MMLLTNNSIKDILIAATSIFFLLTVFGSQQVKGQDFDNMSASMITNTAQVNKYINSKKALSLKRILTILEEHYDVTFLYKGGLVNNKMVKNPDIQIGEKTGEQLSIIIDNLGLKLHRVNKTSYIVLPKPFEGKFKQQMQTVSGTVTDAETGETLPGVNVVLKGTSTGTATNSEGQYKLDVPSLQETLVVSFIGYQTLEVPINGRSQIDIELQLQILTGDDVVVVGYGTQKKENLTGSISTINSEELNKVPTANLGQSLAGKSTGLFVQTRSGKPGTAPDISIRNFGDPLVIVDGVEQADFTNIDPSEIESFSVLKDASAAIYGSKAGNGVILITTKKGRSSTPVINYSSSFSLQEPTAYPSFLSTADFAKASNEIANGQRALRERNGEEFVHQDWNNIPGFEGPFSESEIESMRNGAVPNTDWKEVALKDLASMQNHNINVSGRTGEDKGIGYFVSAAYTDHHGLYKTGDSRNRRYNIRGKVDVQITENLKTEMNLSGRYTNNDDTFIPTSRIFLALRPNMPFFPASFPNSDKIPFSGWDANNVLNLTDASKSGFGREERKYLTGSLSFDYELPFVKGFVAKAKVFYVEDNIDTKRFGTPFTVWSFDEETETFFNPITQNQSFDLVDDQFENRTITFQGMMEYESSFGSLGNNNVKLLGLYETIDFQSNQLRGQIKEFLSPEIDQIFGGNSETAQLSGTAFEDGNVSYAARLNYDYKEKYLLDATVRRDASSRFAPSVRWGTFPSVGIGWRMSQEDFFQNFTKNLFDDFKIRASYGQTGFDRNAAAFQFLSNFSFSGTQVFDGTAQTGIESEGLVNDKLTWETINTYNAGLEFSMSDGLFSLEAEYFYRKRKGILANRLATLPSSFGASLPQENLNSIDNRGIEVAINHRNQVNDFNYSISGNASWSRAKNINIEEQDFEDEDLRRLNQRSGRFQNQRFGFETDGFLTEEDLNYDKSGINYDGASTPNSSLVPGLPKYVDQNGDGEIDFRDQVNIGKGSTPEIIFGITTNSNYKNFSFSMLWQGATSFGIELTDHMRSPVGSFQDGGNIPQHLFDGRWTPENTDARFPRLSDNNTYLQRTSDMFIFSAGYLRLKNATFAYDLPNKLLNKVKGISDLRVQLSGLNLLTINKLSDFNVDPERGGNYNGRFYPQFKSFSIGIDVKIK